ncbi:hypothetical protein [Gracilimonas tropica]|uniref:hypothetical protein n=1 Tax=Gracilimonas tropica TaxID=454600 RepID=UPI0004761E3B|nr:hypothetical protein [Gracilimonas tropica]
MMAENDIKNWDRREGTPYPLGVTSIDDDHACNFALYSEGATGVTLLLYAKDDTYTPCYQYHFDPTINKQQAIEPMVTRISHKIFALGFKLLLSFHVLTCR